MSNDASSQEEGHLVQVGSRRIYLTEKGSGFPLLMLHGGGPGATGLSNYTRNLDAFAAHFRVLVPDMPGYGQSSKGVDRADPFGDLARTMLGLLEVLGIDRAHAIGNSYGGACALRMALDAPSRVSAMVLMGPGGINTTRQLPTKGLMKLLGYYGGSGPSREKMADLLRNYLVYDGSQISDELMDLRYCSSIDPEVIAKPPLQRPASVGAALRMDVTRDVRLRSCPTPTLAVWGADDKVNRPSGGPTLQKVMPNCDLWMVSKTGHWVQWERADEFNALTLAFLGRHTPNAGARS